MLAAVLSRAPACRVLVTKPQPLLMVDGRRFTGADGSLSRVGAWTLALALHGLRGRLFCAVGGREEPIRRMDVRQICTRAIPPVRTAGNVCDAAAAAAAAAATAAAADVAEAAVAGLAAAAATAATATGPAVARQQHGGAAPHLLPPPPLPGHGLWLHQLGALGLREVTLGGIALGPEDFDTMADCMGTVQVSNGWRVMCGPVGTGDAWQGR
jgi:hypothetical protein